MAPPVRTEPKLIHALPLTRYCNTLSVHPGKAKMHGVTGPIIQFVQLPTGPKAFSFPNVPENYLKNLCQLAESELCLVCLVLLMGLYGNLDVRHFLEVWDMGDREVMVMLDGMGLVCHVGRHSYMHANDKSLRM